MTKYRSVEEYLDGLPDLTRSAVEEVIDRVHGVVPGAEEVLSYDMPTFQVQGRRFMHVAGWKSHLSIYPEPSSDPVLTEELAAYSGGKGTLKFPLAQPLPYGLLERVAVTLVAEAGARTG